MNILTLERLRLPGDVSRAASHWSERDPWRAADLVRRDIVGAGATLPIVWLANGLVAVVVSWNMPVLRSRMAKHQGPVLYRSVLNDRLVSGRDSIAPAVLRIEGFIGLARLPMARRTLALLAGLSRVIAAMPRAADGFSAWDAAECDYYGITVAEVDDVSATVAVQGSLEGRSAGRPVGHQQRLMEEQLFDVALRTGAIPTS